MVNKPFKDHPQRLYSEWLETQYRVLNPIGRIKKLVVIPFCHWLIRARQCISPEMNVEAFKKCCISSELVGIDDDTLWNNSIEKGILALSVR